MQVAALVKRVQGELIRLAVAMAKSTRLARHAQLAGMVLWIKEAAARQLTEHVIHALDVLKTSTRLGAAMAL
jgi:hypothetical protein